LFELVTILWSCLFSHFLKLTHDLLIIMEVYCMILCSMNNILWLCHLLYYVWFYRCWLLYVISFCRTKDISLYLSVLITCVIDMFSIPWFVVIVFCQIMTSRYSYYICFVIIYHTHWLWSFLLNYRNHWKGKIEVFAFFCVFIWSQMIFSNPNIYYFHFSAFVSLSFENFTCISLPIVSVW